MKTHANMALEWVAHRQTIVHETYRQPAIRYDPGTAHERATPERPLKIIPSRYMLKQPVSALCNSRNGAARARRALRCGTTAYGSLHAVSRTVESASCTVAVEFRRSHIMAHVSRVVLLLLLPRPARTAVSRSPTHRSPCS